jgi:hypothetical protein
LDRKTAKEVTWSQIEMAKALYNRMRPTARKAIDARLVKSASRPMSTDDRRKFKEKRTTPEGTVDKHGKPFKFARDLESDWTSKNDKPHYGLKEHTSVDGQSGCVLATTLTPASNSGPDGPPARREHDSKYLPYLTIASCHTTDPIEPIFGDKGYRAPWNRIKNSSDQNRTGRLVIKGNPIMIVFTPRGERHPTRALLHMNGIHDGLRLVEASLRLGENHVERYYHCQTY